MPGAKPYSRRNTIQHTLSRMLPMFRYQSQVYRLGERNPPAGFMAGYGPIWEAVSFVLDPLGSLQARVNLQRSFTLIAITATATVRTAANGFRVQLFDTKQQLRFADRGVQQPQFAGGPTAGSAPMFLRDPYAFDAPDSQVLVMVQNLESSQNTVQVVLYGQCLRFNQASDSQPVFPGGSVKTPGASEAAPADPLSQALNDFLNNAGDPATRSVLKSLL